MKRIKRTNEEILRSIKNAVVAVRADRTLRLVNFMELKKKYGITEGVKKSFFFKHCFREICVEDIAAAIFGEIKTGRLGNTDKISKAGMTLNEYQDLAMTTCMPESNNEAYMLLNLVGEVGEFASKVAKHIRKGNAEFSKNHLLNSFDVEDRSALYLEAGDIMWQIFGLCTAMGWKAEDVCKDNLLKLRDRQKRKVIDGNGDNR